MIMSAFALLLAAAVESDVLMGFTVESSRRQREVEAALLALPEPGRCEAHHRELTRTPHTAGTEGARRVAEYVAARFREYGLETEVVSYDVLLAWPRGVEVEMESPRRVRLGSREDPIPEDPQSSDPTASGPWHAYAASGEVTAAVVYVNHGRAEDYELLARMGIDVRGKIALARHFKGYRGGKSLEAEKRGVAALLTYSDPAEDGYVQGDVYPRGPWGPGSHVQRGGNVYDFIVPGDPLTPGWPSLPGARRIAESESRILPHIPSAPLSFRDARVLLEALEGAVRPARDWQGGGPFPYHVGPGPVTVRLKVDVPREVRTIRNVIGRLRGSDPALAHEQVLLSNHHDAWVFGGVDPSSGTATALELARALGQLKKQGLVPRRSLVFGIWDAEEFTLTGSTEWGEEHEAELARSAVACLNVDASTSGDRLSVSAAPPLRALAHASAKAVDDPKGRGSLYDVWRLDEGENVRSYGVLAGERAAEPPVRILGSGSDYTVFFNHVGVPSLDMLFDGPYGVYHSIYDSHEWMRRQGDPGFVYHAAMARLWGVMALRLANADVLPLDYSAYGRDLLSYAEDLEGVAKLKGMPLDLEALREAARSLAGLRWAAPDEPGRRAALNRALLQAERELLAPEGLPGRPWFRHLVYAPLPSYEAETLPGIREAVLAGDAERARAQTARLASAVQRLTSTLAGAGR
jgi:N-acetylated-alpha-linked acidic dipeptidase